MCEICKRLSEERKRLNLSVSDVSEKTKIREHIIVQIENGNLEVLPSVYMKAFINTYCNYLNVSQSDIPKDINDLKKNKTNSSQSPDDIGDELNTTSPDSEHKSQSTKAIPAFEDDEPVKQELDEYKELFKRKPQQKPDINYLNILIYSVIGLVVLLTVYFTVFNSSGSKSTDDYLEQQTTLTITDTNTKKEESKNLFQYFNKSDSIVLTAEAKGESWIRIEMDGERIDEVLLQPGTQKKWTAIEYFLLTQGNVGSVVFKRNGEILEPFGNPGTVAKNIKITENEVINTNPLNENQQRTPVTRKKQQRNLPKRIEPSKIPEAKFLEREDEQPRL